MSSWVITSPLWAWELTSAQAHLFWTKSAFQCAPGLQASAARYILFILQSLSVIFTRITGQAWNETSNCFWNCTVWDCGPNSSIHCLSFKSPPRVSNGFRTCRIERRSHPVCFDSCNHDCVRCFRRSGDDFKEKEGPVWIFPGIVVAEIACAYCCWFPQQTVPALQAIVKGNRA